MFVPVARAVGLEYTDAMGRVRQQGIANALSAHHLSPRPAGGAVKVRDPDCQLVPENGRLCG